MKILSENPNAMKSNQRQAKFYFSAYPLKALNLPGDEQKAYFHVYKKQDKIIKRSVSSKVLPMIDAYKESLSEDSIEVKNAQPDHIEDRESEWFASYE
jgi:hypothetical protein